MSPPDEEIGLREFARRAGVDKKEISRAADRGALKRLSSGKFSAADVNRNWNPALPRRRARRGDDADVGTNSLSPDCPQFVPGETAEAAAERIVSEHPLLSLQDAVKLKENYLGRLKQLEYDLKSSEVVLVKQVAAVVGANLADVRTRLLSIPAELAPRLHRCKSAAELQAALRDAIHEALAALAMRPLPGYEEAKE